MNIRLMKRRLYKLSLLSKQWGAYEEMKGSKPPVEQQLSETYRKRVKKQIQTILIQYEWQ